MPRVSREQSERHRVAIEEAASRLMRERGIQVSVADVMGAAGLTHGGFYGHFDSKDDLVAVGCARAFAQSIGRWERRVAERPATRSALEALVDGYLSPASRAAPGTGCPAAALAGDVARESSDKPVRAAYAEGVVALLGLLIAADDRHAAPDAAFARLSTLVGALMLARATAGRPLSDRFLAAARAQVLGEADRDETARHEPKKKKSKKRH